MGYIYYCNNPKGKCRIGDCVIRAIAKATGQTWESTYINLVQHGMNMGDLPNSNEVAGAYLYEKGFRRYAIPYEKPDDYSISDFCNDNRRGVFVLCTGTHFTVCIDGNYLDTWDCGEEIPQFYFKKER